MLPFEMFSETDFTAVIRKTGSRVFFVVQHRPNAVDDELRIEGTEPFGGEFISYVL